MQRAYELFTKVVMPVASKAASHSSSPSVGSKLGNLFNKRTMGYLLAGTAGGGGMLLSYKVGQYNQFQADLNSLSPQANPTAVKLEKREGIFPDQLIGVKPQEIKDDAVYRFGFSRKVGFHEWHSESGLTHSSIALLDENSEQKNERKKWVLLGRQSPHYARKKESIAEMGFHLGKEMLTHSNHTAGNLLQPNQIATRVDNEKFYDLFEENPFVVHLTEAHLTGREVKAVVQAANNKICKPQYCNMLSSNCYSASTVMLAEAITVLHERNGTSKAETDKSILGVYKLLLEASQDNLSQGVSNNSVVRSSIRNAQGILASRNLIQKPNKGDKSSDEPLEAYDKVFKS